MTASTGKQAAARRVLDQRMEAVFDRLKQHQPCRMMDVVQALREPKDRVQKALQMLRRDGRIVKHGRFKGCAVWTLPEFDAAVAYSVAETLWRQEGSIVCSEKGRIGSATATRARRMPREEAEDHRDYAVRQILTPAHRFRVTIPANAVRSVFDLARRCGA